MEKKYFPICFPWELSQTSAGIVVTVVCRYHLRYVTVGQIIVNI